MTSITSQLIVSLVDKISGPAKGAAAALKNVAAAEKQIAAGGGKGADGLASSLDRVGKAAGRLKAASAGGMGWGEGFQRGIDKLKLTQRELDGVSRSYSRMLSSIRGSKASVGMDALDGWKRRTLANIRSVRDAEAGLQRRQGRMSHGIRHGARFALGVAGAGGGIYAAEHGARTAIEAAAKRQRERVRYEQMGFSSAEAGDANRIANSISQQFPSLSRTDVLSDLRKNAARLGGFARAKEVAETYARARIANTLSGGDEHELEQTVMAAEGAGAANTPQQFRNFLNAFARAKAANPDYSGVAFAKDFRAAGAAKYGLGKDYMENVFPILASHTQGFGVKLATSNSALIGGRQTKKSKGNLRAAGLLDDKGNLVDTKGYQANPFDWTQKHVRPILEKQGVHFGEHMSEEDKRTTSAWATKSFSAKNVADQIITNLLDATLVERARQRKTLGIEASDDLQKKDPGLMWSGAKQQILDLSTALINLGPATTALNAFSSAISSYTSKLSSGTTGDRAGAILGGGLLAGGGAAAAAVAAKTAYGWLTGAGALTASATALDGSAAALTAAAARLAGGSLVDKLTKEAPKLATGAGLLGGALPAAIVAATVIPAAVGFGAYRRNKKLPAGWQPTDVFGGDGEMAWAAAHGPSTITPHDYTLGSKKAFGSGSDSSWQAAPQRSPFAGGSQPAPMFDYTELKVHAAEAGEAGSQAGSAFRNNFKVQLDGVLMDAQNTVAQLKGILGFSVSPTITPKISMPNAPKGASLDGAAAKHAAYADTGFYTA